jgi:beta-lactamase class A
MSHVRTWCVLALLGVAVPAGAIPPPSQPWWQFKEIATAAGGIIGVAAVHLESECEPGIIRGKNRFPMASVYKLPIAVAVLDAVDRGRLRLDSLVVITASDLRTGASPIAERHPKGGVELAIEDLLAGMLIDSDNTASDVLLRLVGGPEAVTAMMRALGCNAIRVDRSEGEIMLDAMGVVDPPPRDTWTLARLRALAGAVPKPRRERAAAAFRHDPRDTATPEDMLALLAKIGRAEVLRDSSRARLFDLMRRSTIGPDRLRGDLPAGTPVAHKTGTHGSVVNDVGIMTLPDNRGHVAIAVFTMNVPGGTPAAERVIARIARAAYDHWK